MVFPRNASFQCNETRSSRRFSTPNTSTTSDSTAPTRTNSPVRGFDFQDLTRTVPIEQSTRHLHKKDYDAHDFEKSSHICAHCHQYLPPDEETFLDKQEGLAHDKDLTLVEWNDSEDPARPMNFPMWRKWLITMSTSLITFNVSFASSIWSTTVTVTATEFNVSEVVMLLGVSLYVVGFSLGPLIWGPLTEAYGRKTPLFAGFFLFAIFQIPVAVAQNLETIFLCRFLAGAFGAAPLAINSAMFADYFQPIDRGVAIAVYAAAVFCGPVAGPVAGSYITQSSLGWRWTAWITLIMACVFGVIAFILTPETFEPILLKRKAQKLRSETKTWALHAKIEETSLTPSTFATRYLVKPVQMLCLEPILVMITLYLSLVYGLLYLTFSAYPYAFVNTRGWSESTASLPFLALLVGIVIASSGLAIYTRTNYASRLQCRGKMLPEDRLPPMILGGFLLPAGLFWFAWTSSPHISCVPQVLSGIFIGAGILLIFMSGISYLVDVYLVNAASAVSANTFIRSLVAAGFPMFAGAMYERLGVAWATSLIAFLTLALVPCPMVFWIYGKQIRGWSRFAFDL